MTNAKVIWDKHLDRWVDDLSLELYEEIRNRREMSHQALSGGVFTELRKNVRNVLQILNTIQVSPHLWSSGQKKSLFYCLLSTGESLLKYTTSKAVAHLTALMQ